MDEIVLKGITWDHSRGFTPLLAISQRFSELNPGVKITWDKRSLQHFADQPIELLTKDYDLLIIDHPWVGCAAATQCVLPLNEYLPASYLADQAVNSVGNSHDSYNYDNKQWALAIDAATPAASYRPDLFDQNKMAIPQNWEELIDLAKHGKVAVPAIPIDLLMNFYSICIAHGEQPFADEAELISKDTGIAAIHTMKEFYSLVHRKMFSSNPVAVAEMMSSTDTYWYCPLAYCYSNYSRQGYARHLIKYARPVSLQGQPLRTTIGGTGLAVSAATRHKEAAIEFTAMAVSPSWQRTIYLQAGGQPGHRAAWSDVNANELCNGFFTELLPVMDNGYTRPRYNGYLYFQDHAGTPLQECIMNDGDPKETLNRMNQIYFESLKKERSILTA
jgi:multiple sugar transport system substrate-binding protein